MKMINLLRLLLILPPVQVNSCVWLCLRLHRVVLLLHIQYTFRVPLGVFLLCCWLTLVVPHLLSVSL
jgi:hypothetical protein